MKKFLGIILLLVFVLGCANVPPEKIENLKDKIIKANADVTSFKFKSVNNLIVKGPEETMSLKLNMDGAMDRTAKKLMVKGTMEMPDMSVPVETYSDGEWIYTKNMDQWIKLKIDNPEMFDMQDQAKYLVDFLKDSEINAEEIVKNEKAVYKVVVTPNMDALLDLAQKNSPIPLQDMGTPEDLFKSMEIIYYINKDNYLAETADIKYVLNINNLTMTNEMSFEMYDINKPQEIVIPEETKDAIDMVEFQKQMMDQANAQQTIPVTEEIDEVEVEITE